MKKTGFVYIWYDSWRKMYYIGCHIGNENDGYICSSNRMRDAHRRRPQDFKRRVIQRDIPRDRILEEEYRWLSMIPKEELGSKYYNVSNRHFGHWLTTQDKSGKKHPMYGKTHTEESKKKMRGKIRTDEQKQVLRVRAKEQFSNPENRKKAGEANIGRTPWLKGRKHSEESRRKMSESLKGHVPWNKGKTGLIKHSEETRQKMRGSRGPQKNPRSATKQ
jgi:hypothetical protein